MGLPSSYKQLPLEVKYNLASYLACTDCKYGIDRLKRGNPTYSAWKIEWAGICALLKTSVHLMREKDARSCLPEHLKSELRRAWNELRKHKERYPLFWEFIDRERNNIIKEYEFSAYEVIIKPDGTTRKPLGLLSFMEEGEKETLIIKSGYYKDRLALEVLSEAAEWVENYIFDVIRRAGYDPNEKRYAGSLLSIPQHSAARTTLLGDLLAEQLEKDKNEVRTADGKN
jgi:hypothetical protein